jgi:hypothetical protein
MNELPKALIEAAQAGTLLPIVGAGVSMSIKNTAGESVFPSWQALLALAAPYVQQYIEKFCQPDKKGKKVAKRD